MQRAAEMLVGRGLTVREVAFRVGYRQPAQFAKAFRRHHGASPSDFRATRRIANGDQRQRIARMERDQVVRGGLSTPGFAAA
jgi:AraC-like DNA-binding protein